MNANINQQHMFSNKMIRALLVPIILEQLLNSIMGTADTMMVSNVAVSYTHLTLPTILRV